MKKEGKRSRIIKERRRNRIIAAAVLILLILIVATVLILRHLKKKEEAAETASTAATEIAPAPEETPSEATTEEAAEAASTGTTKEEEEQELPTDRAMQELETELRDYISQKPGKWSLYLERVESGVKIEIDASEKMRSASLIKLYVAGCCLEDLENGKIEPDKKEEILAVIEKMIKISDNDSCNELIDLLGFERINEFIKEQNCTSTEIARKMLEQSENDNYTSAADCASVLKRILEGTYVSEEASGILMDYLKGQEFVNKIPRGVPEDVVTANKTGELNYVQNDAAIVFAPGGSYVLCVMSENENGAYENEDFIAEISSMVYKKIGEKEQADVSGAGATEEAASGTAGEAPAEEGASEGGTPEEGTPEEGTPEEGTPEESQEDDQLEFDSEAGTASNKPLPIDEKIKAMTLEEKISYLVMPSPEEFVRSEIDTDTVTKVGEATRKCLEKVPGVVGFSLSGSNVENKEQFTALISDAKSTREEMPMAFLLSEETIKNDHMLEKLGVDEGTDPYLKPLLKIGSYEDASRAGTLMAKFLGEYGINTYLLPDLTTITDEQLKNVDTDVIGGYMEGLRNSGINVCASYFPGKSDKKDEDRVYSSDKTGYSIDEKDTEIMKHAIELGADMIMVPACRYPEILPGGEIAFMSKTVMRDMIRDELGFEGVIITDALSSEQLGGSSSTEAAVAALESGADMIYMPDDYEAVLAGIKDAVESKKLSKDRINESAQRVYNMLMK